MGLTPLLGFHYPSMRWNGTGEPPELTLADVLEHSRKGETFTFAEVLDELSNERPGNYRNGSYLLGPLWAELELINSSAQATRWRIDFRDPSGLPIRVFARAANGTTQAVLENRWTMVAPDARFPAMRLVASEAFEVPPGERVTLWIDASYGLPSQTYWRLVEEQRFLADRQADVWSLALLLGFRGALLLALLAFAAVLADRSAFAYSGFHFGLILTSLIFAGFDGYWLSVDPLAAMSLLRVTIGAAMVCYALTLRLFFATRERYPRYDRLLLASTMIGVVAIPVLAVANALLPFVALFVTAQEYAEAAVFVQFVLVSAAGTLLALRDRLPGAMLFLLASGILLLLGFLLALSAAKANPLAHWQVADLFGAVLAVDGVVFAAALVRRALVIRAERDREEAAKMEALADRARLNDQLDAARRDYEEAVEIAERRRRDLATASHDLKQPLLSLQLALARIEGAERAIEGVSYIGQVLERSLEETRPPDAPYAPRAQDRAGAAIGPVLRNVALMFEEEAAAVGMELVVVPSSARVLAEPVELLRIVTNLVANAINHSRGSRVVIGLRRENNGAGLVVADNGRGISPDRLNTIFAPYVAGADSRGEGIGLSAVRELAGKRGWHISVANLPSGGAVFRLGGIALAPAPAPDQDTDAGGDRAA